MGLGLWFRLIGVRVVVGDVVMVGIMVGVSLWNLFWGWKKRRKIYTTATISAEVYVVSVSFTFQVPSTLKFDSKFCK